MNKAGAPDPISTRRGAEIRPAATKSFAARRSVVRLDGAGSRDWRRSLCGKTEAFLLRNALRRFFLGNLPCDRPPFHMLICTVGGGQFLAKFWKIFQRLWGAAGRVKTAARSPNAFMGRSAGAGPRGLKKRARIGKFFRAGWRCDCGRVRPQVPACRGSLQIAQKLLDGPLGMGRMSESPRAPLLRSPSSR